MICLIKSKDKPPHDFNVNQERPCIYAHTDLVSYKPVFDLKKDLSYTVPTNDDGVTANDLEDADRPICRHENRNGVSFWLSNKQSIVDHSMIDAPQYDPVNDTDDEFLRMIKKQSDNKKRKKFKKSCKRYKEPLVSSKEIIL